MLILSGTFVSCHVSVFNTKPTETATGFTFEYVMDFIRPSFEL